MRDKRDKVHQEYARLNPETSKHLRSDIESGAASNTSDPDVRDVTKALTLVRIFHHIRSVRSSGLKQLLYESLRYQYMRPGTFSY
jgi:hypothetical protein